MIPQSDSPVFQQKKKDKEKEEEISLPTSPGIAINSSSKEDIPLPTANGSSKESVFPPTTSSSAINGNSKEEIKGEDGSTASSSSKEGRSSSKLALSSASPLPSSTVKQDRSTASGTTEESSTNKSLVLSSASPSSSDIIAKDQSNNASSINKEGRKKEKKSSSNKPSPSSVSTTTAKEEEQGEEKQEKGTAVAAGGEGSTASSTSNSTASSSPYGLPPFLPRTQRSNSNPNPSLLHHIALSSNTTSSSSCVSRKLFAEKALDGKEGCVKVAGGGGGGGGASLIATAATSGSKANESSTTTKGGSPLPDDRKPTVQEAAALASLPLLHLPREVLLGCLTFLRAWDLGALVLTTKALDTSMVEEATMGIMTSSLSISNSKAGGGGGGPPQGATGRGLGALLEGLRYQEIQSLQKLLSVPEPACGYWVSKSWLSNHRRFAEAQAVRRKAMLVAISGSENKRRNSRERRESDAIPPWNDVNADITCEHGGLRPQMKAGSGGGNGFSPAHPMGKRIMIGKKAWKTLRKYYTGGKDFKSSTAVECHQCSAKDREEKEKLEEERRLRDLELTSSPMLERLYNRRSGAPPASGLAPLDPGLYHLVPRSWLTAWRNYIRDPKAPRPRPPDCCLLLCEAHGLPLIPPHVTGFLEGERKGVLSSLSGRSGIVCEILSIEEWDEVTKVYPTDFCLKFSVDPEDLIIAWSTTPCARCEPCAENAQVTIRNRQRKWSM